MEIIFETKWHGSTLTIIDESTRIEKDVTQPIYEILENGKKDYKNRIGKEVDPKILDMFSSVLEDMIYYSDSEYDSSRLISYLFPKLPQEKLEILLKELNKDYSTND